MQKNYIDIIEAMKGLPLYDLHRVECYLYNKTDDPGLIREVKRMLHVGDKVKYYSREKNILIEAEVLELKRNRLLVRNYEDGAKWNILYAAVTFDQKEIKTTHFKSNEEKLTRSDLHVGQFVSFYDKEENETIGKVIKLNLESLRVGVIVH